MKKRPNVILITVDSLRADHLGFMGYEKNITPNIDLLAKESIIFSNAYANGPITPHSFPSILTSTYPIEYGGVQKIKKPRTLISEVLKENGFITAAFHSNPFLSSYFGYNRGWDFFEDIKPRIYPQRREKKLIRILGRRFKEIIFDLFPEFFFKIKYLKYKIEKPNSLSLWPKASFLNRIIRDFIYSQKNTTPSFFLWVHYMDIHYPYLSPKAYFQKRQLSYLEHVSKELLNHLQAYCHKKPLRKFAMNFMKKNLKRLLNLYDLGIRNIDQEIGDLIKFFKKEKIYENSIIFLTSDHGEEFLEHGGGFHYPQLYNEILHVPLLVKIPNSKSRRIKKGVSLIDIPPTICDILKIKRNPSFKGENLFKSSDSPIFSQTIRKANKKRALISKTESELWVENFGLKIENLNQCKIACQFHNFKYIFDYGNKTEELYNLSTDSKEQNNLSSFKSRVLFQMRNIVQEFEKRTFK